jgi:23S rRNA (cytidine1920-2'-O)/16S rRNA (cytidine1409-2'-O)-methyltransferase
VVELGIAPSRERAQALIRSGVVLVDDEVCDKPGTKTSAQSEVRLRAGARLPRFVSRGGDKLAGALEDLALDPSGCRVLDVGASTGGFTDCLLQHGARFVVAVDVGYGQLHPKLRSDPRVAVAERVNARELPAELCAEPPDWVVVDVSFISAKWILRRLAQLAPRARVLILVKPQFEVGREQVGKGGVVRDDALRAGAVDGVASEAAALGWREVGRAESRVAGPKGNREIFLLLEPTSADPRPQASD